MKKFVSENWYKLMIGSSLLMASFGFMVHSISPVKAEPSKANNINLLTPGPGYRYITGCGIYNGYVYYIHVDANDRQSHYKVPIAQFE